MDEATRKVFSIAWTGMSMRAIQGLSGGNKVDPSLQDNVAILDCNSILQSGLSARGKDSKEGRQTVCFTGSHERTTKRQTLRRDRTTRGTSSDEMESACAICSINLQSAQDRGLIFWQKNFNAIIFNNSVPADCLFKKKWYISKPVKSWIMRFVCRHVCHRRSFSKVFGKFNTRAKFNRKALGGPLADQVTK